MVTNNDCNYQPTQYNVQTGGASGLLNNVAPSSTSGVPVISQGSSAQPIFGTAVVAGGGTGAVTFTAYGVMLGGTTATGALQSVTPSATTTALLTSGGTGAVAAWKNLSVKNQVFTATGTYTPTAGMIYCSINIIGGGGAGGGAAATGAATSSVGAGGGSGENRVGIFSAATIGASQAVTIGAGGTGVSGATGNAGGTTSVGALITAGGGGGGQTGATAATSNCGPGSGGSGGSGGDYGNNGEAGFYGFSNITSPTLLGGYGAGSVFGGGGVVANTGVSNQGQPGNAFGTGGGGSCNFTNQSALLGGAGIHGAVIVTEYIIS